MKIATLLPLFIVLIACKGQPTEKTYTAIAKDSGVEIVAKPPHLNTNLELLGRVWGFLKYHHPTATKGNLNWDFELFEVLPNYLDAQTNLQRDKVLLDWIDDLGEVTHSKPKITDSTDVKLTPDHNWLNTNDISDALKRKLGYIYKNRSQGKQHYIQMTSFIGNPKFTNEAAYKDISYPDDGYNLLALFRYWNAINYFYPYKHLTDKDWNLILKQYIPLFLDITSELEYELAILKLTAEINDSHANVLGDADKISAWYGKYHSSLILSFVENTLVVTDFYNNSLEGSGIKIGDIILEINDDPTEEILVRLTPYTSASNRPALLRKIASNILRSNTPNLKIKIKDQSGERTVNLELFEIKELKRENWAKEIMSNTYTLLPNNIGYIPAVSVEDGEIPTIMKSFEKSNGIIIDLRNYPNTTDLLYKLVPYFMSSEKKFAMFTKGNINHPGEFVFTEPLKFSKNKNYYKNKVVVLVNEYSQSLAEYMAMAYQIGHHTTIIGSTTAGADGDVSYLNLPGGIKTILSGIGVYYPDGLETQRTGIIPDLVVKPTIKGIQNDKDQLLENAIDFILKE